jgi:hypothetical protein
MYIKRRKWGPSENTTVLVLCYSYVPVCRFYVVRCVIIICLPCYFIITGLFFLNSICFMFLFCMFVFYSVHSVFCIVLCNVSPFLYICLFPIFVQVYQPLPPGGNSIAVNKYHVIIQYTFLCTVLLLAKL